MDFLTNKPDVLFLIAVRHASLVKLTIVPKLRRDIYRAKTLKAVTYVEHITHSGYIKRYYVMDQLHREDGPAVTIKQTLMGVSYEVEGWYYRGKLHRVGGPAQVMANYHTIWAKHGKLHREDGPAIIDHNLATGKWYYEGYRVDPKEMDELVKGTETINDIKSHRPVLSRDTLDMYSRYLFT